MDMGCQAVWHWVLTGLGGFDQVGRGECARHGFLRKRAAFYDGCGGRLMERFWPAFQCGITGVSGLGTAAASQTSVAMAVIF